MEKTKARNGDEECGVALLNKVKLHKVKGKYHNRI